jgi:low affinity Fe/Cu permease
VLLFAHAKARSGSGHTYLGRRIAITSDVRKRAPSSIGQRIESLSGKATKYAGSSPAFGIAVALVLIWLLTGPLFGFSDTWQLVINTGTTIITFLMVFLIQRAQNKDTQAVHLKLNEIVAAIEGASNRLIDVEDLSEEELRVLRKHFQRLAELAKRDNDIRKSRSVEEAETRHRIKHPKKTA